MSPTRRPLILLIVFVLAAGGLASRLVFWQVMQHTHLLAVAQAQRGGQLVEPTMRGKIYDAAAYPVATDISMNEVDAAPREIKHPFREARVLGPLLGWKVSDLHKVLSDGASYAKLAAKIDEKLSRRISRLHLTGISLVPQIQRFYPDHNLMGQIVGYTDANGNGQYGLEQEFNGLLAGKASLRDVTRGAGRTSKPSAGPMTPSNNGGDLYISVKPKIQNLIQSALQSAVKKQHADSGSILVMDPNTGYILGMAGYPTYDPNHYSQYAQKSESRRFINPTIGTPYEPGSTFKIITMASGLDARVVTPQAAFEDTGTWTVGNVQIHNWNGLGNGWENMTQVLQHSANVGASFVASKLGPRREYTYIRKFGFGHTTGIDLAGEAPGQVWFPGNKNWSIVSQYTNSYGQGLTVTPLQLVRAVAAVANGGRLMKPQIVRKIVYKGHTITTHPVVQRRVISKQTAHTLTNMLVHSAIGGEASKALIKGYDIAAKTGTANVAGPNGQYLPPTVTVASTIAYAPAAHPRFIILVRLDHPRPVIWGSLTAAPVIHNLFQSLFLIYHIAPSPHALNQ